MRCGGFSFQSGQSGVRKRICWATVVAFVCGLMLSISAVDMVFGKFGDRSGPRKLSILLWGDWSICAARNTIKVAGQAKDPAAGAVLLAEVVAAIVGLVKFLRRISAILSVLRRSGCVAGSFFLQCDAGNCCFWGWEGSGDSAITASGDTWFRLSWQLP